MSARTVTVTLGHEGLTMPVQDARFTLSDMLRESGSTLLAFFLDGVGGCWADEVETCDAWLISVPERTLPDLQRLLSAYASTLGQDALGCVIHDTSYGPSYCAAVR